MRFHFSAVLAVFAFAASGFPAETPKAVDRAKVVPAPAAETQITYTVRVLTVRGDLLERFGIDSKPTGTLTDGQLRSLLETIEGDRLSQMIQCPKVTTFDGQEAAIQNTEQQSFTTGLEVAWVNEKVVFVPKHTHVETGTTISLHGKVSADGKATQVKVSYKDVRVNGLVEMVPVTVPVPPSSVGKDGGKPVPFTQFLQLPRLETMTIEKADLTIPSGGHAVISGPITMTSERQDYVVPLLSKIPYLNRLYKNVGIAQTTTRMLLIVSPQVTALPQELPVQR